MTAAPAQATSLSSVWRTTTSVDDGASVVASRDAIHFEPVAQHEGLSIARIDDDSNPDRHWILVKFEPHTVLAPHATPTTDYVTVLAGELDLIVPDADPVRLRAGDCVVQRGATHSWRTSDIGATTSVIVIND